MRAFNTGLSPQIILYPRLSCRCEYFRSCNIYLEDAKASATHMKESVREEYYTCKAFMPTESFRRHYQSHSIIKLQWCGDPSKLKLCSSWMQIMMDGRGLVAMHTNKPLPKFPKPRKPLMKICIQGSQNRDQKWASFLACSEARSCEFWCQIFMCVQWYGVGLSFRWRMCELLVCG